MPAATIAEEDQLRANLYLLLGQLLGRAPDRNLLRSVGQMRGDETELGQAIVALARAAQAAAPEVLEQEYFDLFIGVGQGELVPYGSYYLTGFLHEKPLARLRGDLARLGVERAEGVHEPEDHIAALCETMGALILGAFDAPADLATQRDFFDSHVGCWAPRFFEDLQGAKSAVFYMPVGSIGRIFMGIENEAFRMAT